MGHRRLGRQPVRTSRDLLIPAEDVSCVCPRRPRTGQDLRQRPTHSILPQPSRLPPSSSFVTFSSSAMCSAARPLRRRVERVPDGSPSASGRHSIAGPPDTTRNGSSAFSCSVNRRRCRIPRRERHSPARRLHKQKAVVTRMGIIAADLPSTFSDRRPPVTRVQHGPTRSAITTSCDERDLIATVAPRGTWTIDLRPISAARTTRW